MKDLTFKKAFTLTFIGILAFGVLAMLSVFFFAQSVQSSAPSGLNAGPGVATTTQLGPDIKIELFAGVSSTGVPKSCSSRIISTTDGTGQDMFLTFSDPVNANISSTTLSGVVGFWQAASTTKAYDSGIYGCGRWFGHASASTTITKQEFD